MMRWFAFFFFALGLSAMPAMAGVVMSLKTDAVVNAARVKLSDLVDIDAESHQQDEPLIKTMAAVDMGNAPLPGYSLRFSRKEIERIIRASGQVKAIEWRGAEAVKVERLAKVFDSTQLAIAAESYLKQVLGNGQNQVVVETAERLPELLLADGKVDIKARNLSRAEAMHARVTVWLDVTVAGMFSRSVRVPMKVKVMEQTLVAKRDLLKGVTPACEDLLVLEMDIASLDGAALPADCSKLKGSLKRNIPSGTALTQNYLQLSNAISHGDTVNLLFSSGALLLESKALALANGEVGQRIQVRPAAATETIAAIVVAPGVAKVIGN
ncbi:flagellar basal body P-ring formation chaperone FlgA [Undibacterium sp. TS12]|uniref:flagellar basal body P-ring formation chaperone FlgA n=1 Tax=Undibacterium sp. TS12 TaxID=2908202 RepID=UPI001F4CFA62|nr:flagellar basal body P-ring formation chaperone FlgA [Undibacterium sp. TS12]MCH8618761.1 flagellar basal body P-ring formation chaperone FlgA [Undibacterium sp. TS12]